MARSRPRANTTLRRTITWWKWSRPAPGPKDSECPSSGIFSPLLANLMAHSIVMPALEMAQETGKLLSWRKKEGDAIAKGEPLLDVETDKAVVEIEAPADGILAGIKAHAGAVIPVGQTIAWIVNPGEKPPEEEVSTASGAADGQGGACGGYRRCCECFLKPAVAHAPAANVRVSPKARRLAREHGVELSRVRGSGGDGEILAEDRLHLSRRVVRLMAGRLRR